MEHKITYREILGVGGTQILPILEEEWHQDYAKKIQKISEWSLMASL